MDTSLEDRFELEHDHLELGTRRDAALSWFDLDAWGVGSRRPLLTCRRYSFSRIC